MNARNTKILSDLVAEPRYIKTVEDLRASDSWEYREVLYLVEQGDLPSVESYVADRNAHIYEMSGGKHGIPYPEEVTQAKLERKVGAQHRKAAQRSGNG